MTHELLASVAAMDAFYEEDERILGHAADPYHRIDIRRTSRHLVVRAGERIVADTTQPLVLYESGFAPRWYVPRAVVRHEYAAVIDRRFLTRHTLWHLRGMLRFVRKHPERLRAL